MRTRNAGLQEDPEDPGRAKRACVLRVDRVPPCLLTLSLALQHVLVQSSMLVLALGLLQQQLWLREGDRQRLLASSFFHCSVSTLLQAWLGTRLPLIQTPSLEFIISALVLTSKPLADVHLNLSTSVCMSACEDPPSAVTDPLRELQGMVLTSGLVQLALGASGLSSLVLRHCGPLVLAPLFCVIGFSVHREAALLCSDHWGIAALVIVLIVFLSQHLRFCSLPAILGATRHPVCRMVSVLVPLLSVWAVSAALQRLGYFHPHQASELLSTLHFQNTSNKISRITLNTSDSLSWINLNSSSILPCISQNMSYGAPWFSFPLLGTRLPLLSAQGVAAGVAAAFSSFISSLGVYLLTARLLGTSPPPPAACNRGLCAEGLGSVSAALLGGPVGLSSSVPNACTLGLSQCGSRRTVQLGAVMGLVLGVSPRLAQLLISFPLAIHGAVLSVTYTVAVGTGVTYFQYTHMDSGRNIFNIGFAVFMSLLLPRWFNFHKTFVLTGVASLDVLFISLLTLPVFIVGLLAFFLDNTVSGSLSERGLCSSTRRKRRLDDGTLDRSLEHIGIYDPPYFVQRVLDLPGLRVIPFSACRTQANKDVELPLQETSDLLNSFEETQITGAMDTHPHRPEF
ncbi:solute carrier family 23 member 3 isoform X2 [Paramormyrops kingsleyae]|uniref:Solute carrier family 23 member 3 n=1 Tax=Paramormyrops kingsleyae TaxID=1676925 RepID=A0A3B3R7C7_9TELE|nr:solute carrier family 23 member 3 isoform X2 [Paramormyrops kingsleyae]